MKKKDDKVDKKEEEDLRKVAQKDDEKKEDIKKEKRQEKKSAQKDEKLDFTYNSGIWSKKDKNREVDDFHVTEKLEDDLPRPRGCFYCSPGSKCCNEVDSITMGVSSKFNSIPCSLILVVVFLFIIWPAVIMLIILYFHPGCLIWGPIYLAIYIYHSCCCCIRGDDVDKNEKILCVQFTDDNCNPFRF